MITFDDLRDGWSKWGTKDPYWSTVTLPRFMLNQLDREEYYKTPETTEFGTLFVPMLEQNGIGFPDGVGFDFGCGCGRNTFFLAERMRWVIGYDISPGHLREAERWMVETDARNVIFIQGEEESLFPSMFRECYDLVFSVLVLQHIPPDISMRYIREFTQLLSPGGVGFFHIPVEGYQESQDPALSLFSVPQGSVEAEIERGGCQVIEIRRNERTSGPDMVAGFFLFVKEERT